MLWNKKKNKPTLTVNLSEISEEHLWSNEDAKSLLVFLKCSTGKKFQDIIKKRIIDYSLDTAFTEQDQAIRSGMILFLNEMNRLSQGIYEPELDDNYVLNSDVAPEK